MSRYAGFDCKDEVEQAHDVPIGHVARWSQGLQPGYSGSVRWSIRGREISSIGYTVLSAGAVLLRYTQQGQDLAYTVSVTYTTLPSGGRRPWWHCPACGRRCGVIYGCQRGGRYFVCRRCGDLAYASQHTRTRRWMDWGDELATLGWGRRLLAKVEAEMAQQAAAAVPPIAAPPVVPRPRGRPRTKRKYTRRSIPD